MGAQWHGMGSSLMRLHGFRESILRSDEVVKPLGLQVSELLLSKDEATFDDLVHAFVSLTAIQVCPGAQRPVGRMGCRDGAGGRTGVTCHISPSPDRSHRPADLNGRAAGRHHWALPGGGGLRLRRWLSHSGGDHPHRLLAGPVHQGGQHSSGSHGGRGWVSPRSPILPLPAWGSGVGVSSLVLRMFPRGRSGHPPQHPIGCSMAATGRAEATWG